jgi:hypothetical protein
VHQERSAQCAAEPALTTLAIDHLSFSVPTRADLDVATRLLDERGGTHRPICAPVPLGLAFRAFFDPAWRSVGAV